MVDPPEPGAAGGEVADVFVVVEVEVAGAGTGSDPPTIDASGILQDDGGAAVGIFDVERALGTVCANSDAALGANKKLVGAGAGEFALAVVSPDEGAVVQCSSRSSGREAVGSGCSIAIAARDETVGAVGSIPRPAADETAQAAGGVLVSSGDKTGSSRSGIQNPGGKTVGAGGSAVRRAGYDAAIDQKGHARLGDVGVDSDSASGADEKLICSGGGKIGIGAVGPDKRIVVLRLRAPPRREAAKTICLIIGAARHKAKVTIGSITIPTTDEAAYAIRVIEHPTSDKTVTSIRLIAISPAHETVGAVRLITLPPADKAIGSRRMIARSSTDKAIESRRATMHRSRNKAADHLQLNRLIGRADADVLRCRKAMHAPFPHPDRRINLAG